MFDIMTRRIFVGLIPAVVAAAKWPIEKLRGVPHVPGVLAEDYVWSNSAVILPAGSTYKPIKILFQEVGFLETKTACDRVIVRMYNVPPHLLKGFTDV